MYIVDVYGGIRCDTLDEALALVEHYIERLPLNHPCEWFRIGCFKRCLHGRFRRLQHRNGMCAHK